MSLQEDHNDDAALAGEYVLHLLERDERAMFEARLAVEPALRDLVRDWDHSFANMADSIPSVAPPALVKDKLNARLFPDTVKPKRSWWSWLAGGVAVAVIVVGAVILTPMLQTQSADAIFTANVAAGDGTLVVAVRFIAETGALELTREAGAARPGRVLELWLIAENTDTPVSLGVLPKEADTQIDIEPEIAQLLANGLLAISDEPLGGSPTGAPTGDVLAIGSILSI